MGRALTPSVSGARRSLSSALGLTVLATVVSLLSFALPADSTAQALDDETAIVERPPFSTAPVVVDGVVLFDVRGASAFPAATRAERQALWIAEAAQDPRVDPDKIEIVQNDIGTELRAGRHALGLVAEADARLEGLRVHELALARREAIKNAITRYRAARTPVQLGTSAAKAFVATALLGLLLAVLLPLFRRVDRFLQRRWKKHTEELAERSFELLRADRLQGLVRGTLRGLRVAIVFALTYLYLSYTLALFPWTRFIAIRLTVWILSPLRTITQAVLANIPDLIFLVILALVVRYGLKLLRLFFHGVDRGSIRFEGFEAEWAWPTYKIVRLAIIAFAVVVAYPYVPGSGSEDYTALAAEQGLILHTTVGIVYEVPWRQVEAMLLEAAVLTPGLLDEPAPFVLQTALADYAVNYELNVFCRDPRQMMPLYTALHRNIQDVFNEHGIQIMTPSYVADPPDAKVVPKERWYTPPAARPPSGPDVD